MSNLSRDSIYQLDGHKITVSTSVCVERIPVEKIASHPESRMMEDGGAGQWNIDMGFMFCSPDESQRL